MATKVKDKLWSWGHEANSHSTGYSLDRQSRMTPAEGAFYLGTPNLIMVRYNGNPAPPFDQHLISYRPLQNVVWSIVGASGVSDSDEIDQFRSLASKFPNLSGAMMDDFFHPVDENGSIATFSPEQLTTIREQLVVDGRRRDLWVVLYDFQLDFPFEAHLEKCDVTTFWTWKADDLEKLEANFERFHAKMPEMRKVLGIYMYDYGQQKEMPVEVIRAQCELGLRWLRQGRIEGMIFLATCICDLELEAVEWARQWIAEVGEETL